MLRQQYFGPNNLKKPGEKDGKRNKRIYLLLLPVFHRIFIDSVIKNKDTGSYFLPAAFILTFSKIRHFNLESNYFIFKFINNII